MDNPETEVLSAPAILPERKTLGAKIKEEAKEIAAIALYLGIWLPILATMRCLILLQYGINEFKNAYIMAFISAIALAKVIAVTQKLPIANRMNHLPVLWTSVYKSFFFTTVTLMALRLEDKLAHKAIDPNSHFPLAGVICHAIGLFGIIFVLFIYRDLDQELGKGTLHKLLLSAREKRNS